MKKIGLLAFLLLGTLVLVGCGSKNDVKDVEVVDEVTEEQTLGEQIDEAQEALKDCEESCKTVGDTEFQEQCLAGCELAEEYMDNLEDASQEVGVEDSASDLSDLSQEEMQAMVEAMQK